MDINVGDIWKDNEGDQVIITQVDRDVLFPAYNVKGLKYNNNGISVRTYMLNGQYDRFERQSRYDLVELVGNVCTLVMHPDITLPLSNECTDSVEFNVGDVYKSLDNNLFLIMNIDDDDDSDELYVVSGIQLDGEIPERHSWTRKGEFLHNFSHHPYNLDEKIKNVLKNV